MTYYPCSTCGYDGSHRCYYGGYEFGCGRKSCECVCTPRDKRYWAEINRLNEVINRLEKDLSAQSRLAEEKNKINEVDALKRLVAQLEAK